MANQITPTFRGEEHLSHAVIGEKTRGLARQSFCKQSFIDSRERSSKPKCSNSGHIYRKRIVFTMILLLENVMYTGKNCGLKFYSYGGDKRPLFLAIFFLITFNISGPSAIVYVHL